MRVRHILRSWNGRRGLSLALVAVCMPALLLFAGLAADLGVSMVANAQLQSVADAAALAGAKQLASASRMSPGFNPNNLFSQARLRARAIGQANLVLGQAAVLQSNDSNAATGDIVIGYKNLAVAGSKLDTSPALASLFNSVEVRARRDADHSGLVPAFFTKMIGHPGTALVVRGLATAQNYEVKGFKCNPPGYTTLIPIALSKTTYDAMLTGKTTDSYTAKSGAVQKVPDGLFESSLYPVGSGAGNWGTVRIGVNNNSTSVLASQIQYGVSTSEIGTASGGSCLFQISTSLPLGGNPGVSLGIKPALMSLIGKTVIVPIYDPAQSGGNGSNYVYTVVKFAPVTVLDTYFKGVNSGVLVQPAITTDPTVILGGPSASWADGGVIRLRLTE